MKVKYPIKEHWERFSKLHSKETIDWIETILDEEVSAEAFIIAYRRINKVKRVSNKQPKGIYKFLTENNWIKKG